MNGATALSEKAGGTMHASHQPVRLQMARLGTLDDLKLEPVTRRSPGPGEIEVEVRAVGLNLREVLKALDVYSGPEVQNSAAGISFDGDCAGRVVAVGENVNGFRVGDAVIGVGPDVFATYATLPARYFVRKPERLSFEEAATIPLVFLTAYYGLHHLARMQAGERILIHAAAGGVGLAAVQLSQRAGAEVFATAGQEDKRQFLKSVGVKHVMNSRSYAFADEIMHLTGGQGVNIVLNSLAGEFIPRSLAVLAPFGRFVEIGKRDIYEKASLGLYPFRNNLSFFAIDLIQMPVSRMMPLLEEIMQLFAAGDLHPLHHRVFPISEVVHAFQHLRRANHIGKVVISLNPAASQSTGI